MHETEDYRSKPRFLITDAYQKEAKRILETWDFKGHVSFFTRKAKLRYGFEAAQDCSEEANKRYSHV